MTRKPTDAELDILNVLWANGPSSVRFVHTELSRNREVVYTTTLKTMQVMTEKGFLRRDTSQKSHLYEAAISRDMIQEDLLDKLLDTVFEGSPGKLVLHALGNRPTSREDLDEIKKLIQQLENEGNGNQQ